MAEKKKVVRNEVEITLAGKVRTMRATFEALQSIEARLGNLTRIIQQVVSGDVGITLCATVTYYGLAGFGDTRLTYEEVGKAVMDMGLGKAMKPVTDFLMIAMAGVDVPLDGPAPK
ncbi:GTA-gp10 family protein [Frankia sp. RB7]|nr:GTA-gp10 family protein [Frankia sp. RB7]